VALIALSTYRWLSGSHLIPAFGARLLPTLTHKDLSDYIAEKIQAGRLAPRMVNHSLVLLKQMPEAAVDWGYLPHNPARRVRKLKIGLTDRRSGRSGRSAASPGTPRTNGGRCSWWPCFRASDWGDPGARLGSAEPPDLCHPQDRCPLGLQ